MQSMQQNKALDGPGEGGEGGGVMGMEVEGKKFGGGDA